MEAMVIKIVRLIQAGVAVALPTPEQMLVLVVVAMGVTEQHHQFQAFL
jgi:hypothetical protein